MRLIDADELVKEYCKNCSLVIQDLCKPNPACDVVNWLAVAPTVDAEPVRYGKWIRKEKAGFLHCSNCGYIPIIFNPNYCSKCGAKMEVE